MKTLMKLLPICLLMLSGTALAQVKAQEARAILVLDDDAMQVWITAASATNVEYKSTERTIDRKRMPRAKLVSIFFYEPPLFKEALSLYKGRDYEGAKAKFAECREAFKKIDDLPSNYSTLSGFYEIECCRKLWDLEGLAALLENYRPGALVRETNKNQLEIFNLWDAVRTKSWRRLVSDTDDMLAQKKWTGSQRAQIYYCRGLALEGLEDPIKALIAFNGAFTADYTASEALTKRATLNCLRLIKSHEEVRQAMKFHGTDDESKNSTGALLLQEGVALCGLWDTALGGGQALPEEYKELLKYAPKND